MADIIDVFHGVFGVFIFKYHNQFRWNLIAINSYIIRKFTDTIDQHLFQFLHFLISKNFLQLIAVVNAEQTNGVFIRKKVVSVALIGVVAAHVFENVVVILIV